MSRMLSLSFLLSLSFSFPRLLFISAVRETFTFTFTVPFLSIPFISFHFISFPFYEFYEEARRCSSSSIFGWPLSAIYHVKNNESIEWTMLFLFFCEKKTRNSWGSLSHGKRPWKRKLTTMTVVRMMRVRFSPVWQYIVVCEVLSLSLNVWEFSYE